MESEKLDVKNLLKMYIMTNLNFGIGSFSLGSALFASAILCWRISSGGFPIKYQKYIEENTEIQ